jgi:glycosyltransferase involved in cell wall biosynthesis
MVEPTQHWSIVVPLYNMRGTIGRTVESIVAQTERRWELIVVDDGSSDGGADVVLAFDDPRITLIQQENSGEGAARNRGIEAARSSLVTFVDADDYWAPGHLENLQALVDEFPDAALYATAYQLVFGPTSGRPVRLRPGLPPRGLIADYFRDCVDVEVLVCASGVAARRDMLQSIGCFPVGVYAGADLITWSRLACLGPLAYSTDPTALVDAPPVDRAHRHRAVRRPQRPDRVGEALAQLAQDNPARAASIDHYRAWLLRLRALAFAELGDRRESVRELVEAVRIDGPTLRDGMIAAVCVTPAWLRARILSWLRIRRRRSQADVGHGTHSDERATPGRT